jgi:protein involved in polysaccharide export with SLBB domain
MGVWMLGLFMATVVGGVALRAVWVARRRRRVAERRKIEAPNSHYSSTGVRNQEDRERWGSIDLDRLHPLNQEEVERLLRRIDADGVQTLSARDRLFLDNMTLPRMG